MFFLAEFIQACSGCGAERVLTPSANTAEKFLIVYFRHLKISISLYEQVFHADLTFTLGYNMSLSHMLTHFPTLLLSAPFTVVGTKGILLPCFVTKITKTPTALWGGQINKKKLLFFACL